MRTKFFIPDAKDAAEAESVYEGILKFHIEQMGASLGARRIYSVRGRSYKSETLPRPSLFCNWLWDIVSEPTYRLARGSGLGLLRLGIGVCHRRGEPPSQLKIDRRNVNTVKACATTLPTKFAFRYASQVTIN